MATVLMSFNNNPNVGLYAFVTDKFALVGREVNKNYLDELARILKVPVHSINIAGTSLVGVFLVGNSDLVLVPSITFDGELEQLKKLGINYKVFNTDFTCLGNNIVMNENGALVSEDLPEKDVKNLSKILDIPVKRIQIADTTTPGSCIILRGDKALIHRGASQEEIKIIEKTLKVKTISTTINLGIPYIKSGILCNDNGMIIGEASGPAEVMNAEEGLGFIDG
ncbi:MAG: translation initiation factor IF-6 [Nanoarchaeota archaeon]|nr:translation initiation factor IF-6 [Nanoarchaeota archaeon]MBU1269244.1 translation initiation factor IF-6 [Nanoarchaeota archaeon]MBU1604930.1 translation initiation factor IF-6 [Nanoarchaeota archaeon]MBU2443501.1 translation initiation factor IF-6 [Nanoarchaeota archaeon]